MLIDIKLKPNYVKETVTQRTKLLNSFTANSTQRKFIEKSIENTLLITSMQDLFTRIDKGIYKGIVYDSYLENLTGLNFKPYRSGIADDVKQVSLYFKELETSSSKFVIIFDKLNKSINRKENIKENELYIGNYDWEDEQNFKRAIYFNIFILEEEAKVS